MGEARIEVRLESQGAALHEPASVLLLPVQQVLNAALEGGVGGRNAGNLQGIQRSPCGIGEVSILKYPAKSARFNFFSVMARRTSGTSSSGRKYTWKVKFRPPDSSEPSGWPT